MSLDIIKELMEKFSDSNIHKMDVEFDDIKIRLEKEDVKHVVSQVMEAPVMASPAPAVMNNPIQSVESVPEVMSGEQIKAPLVGVYYSKSSPEAKPFVEVGQHVNAGDTLCIIEAMKVMNEIKAPVSGTISSILVKEEDLVEFDQVIMTIQG